MSLGLVIGLLACSAEPSVAPAAEGGTSTGELPDFDPVPPNTTGDVNGTTVADGTGDDDDDTTDGDPDPPGAGPRSALVHLFEWSWLDIAAECEDVLGPAGYGGVQISPPQEYALIPGAPWWERYQPVSYQLAGRSGDEAELAEMVERCAAAGVGIYVDAILNHMAFGSGMGGSAGTEFSKYEYAGLYEAEHFHDCMQGISDWGSRDEIHNCELATLPDLATELPHVRTQLSGYLQHLIDLGVEGFRLDAAKHVPAEDLQAILGALDPAPVVYQEVIHLSDDDAVSAYEYTGLGRVTEFRFGLQLSSVIRDGQLASLENFGEDWGFLPASDALVFVDNHDNQRGHGAGDPLTHADPGTYRLAIAFMLGWPYGRPKVMSSYQIDDGDHGPPSDSACEGTWICEHRWPSTIAMVGFRNATAGEPVERWWSNGNDQIAFARGNRGFFVLNREEKPSLTQAFDTGLPAGRYCEVIGGGVGPDGGCIGEAIEVGPDGTASITVGPLDVAAIHVLATSDDPS